MSRKMQMATPPPFKAPTRPVPVLPGVAPAGGHGDLASSGILAVHRSSDLPAAAQTFLSRLVELGLVDTAAAWRFLDQNARSLGEYSGPSILANALVRGHLLTEYQADRVLAGTTHGLV